ncbi:MULTISPECIES: hypothetical protein [Paenibacillus]|uniref:DUF3169 family protein n=1 Tax=Paenibacillus campinasensis TaxID=66347 RepID=A0A268F1L8_9BACL|nr:hypothetical protein [Paenibacillus campinasensis]MUG65687.1 hypothetical protein [Paenibacillus campinasensis]PAD79275.1 hypothetical protein CHH67_04910 [Paenibacillus campinasensis]
MNKLLRSPFWSVLSMVIITLFMIIKIEAQRLPTWLYTLSYAALAVCFIFILSWLVAVLIHNRRHPKQKVKWHLFYPVEFREEDEGMRWLTYMACRKVYIMFYVALPLILLVLFLFPEHRSLPVLLIGALAVSQYCMYWSVIRKANIGEDET